MHHSTYNLKASSISLISSKQYRQIIWCFLCINIRCFFFISWVLHECIMICQKTILQDTFYQFHATCTPLINIICAFQSHTFVYMFIMFGNINQLYRAAGEYGHSVFSSYQMAFGNSYEQCQGRRLQTYSSNKPVDYHCKTYSLIIGSNTEWKHIF